MSSRLAESGTKPFAKLATKLRGFANADGKVDYSGFDDSLRGLKLFLPEWQVMLVFAVVDQSGNGLITPAQFVATLKDHLSHTQVRAKSRSPQKSGPRPPSRPRSTSRASSASPRRTSSAVVDSALLDESLRFKAAGQPRAALQRFEEATDGVDVELQPTLQQHLKDIETLVAKSPPGAGVLQVSQIACNGVLPAEGGSSGQPHRSDPYVRFTLKTGQNVQQTNHEVNTLSPVFKDQVLDIEVGDEDTITWRLLIEVFDNGPRAVHDFLGSLEIDLSAEFKSDWAAPSGINIHYYLTDPNKQVSSRVSTDYIAQQQRAGNKYPYGDIKFHLRYQADSYVSRTSPGARSSHASPGRSRSSGSLRGSPPAVKSHISRTVRDMNAGRTGSGGTVGSPPPIPGHTFDLSGCWEATGTAGQKESFQLLAGNRLPPNEGTLSVSIVEARGLLPTFGSSTATSSPSVKITYDGKNQHTPVAKKTLNPTLESWGSPDGLVAQFDMKGCAQDTQLGYLRVTPQSFQVLIEVESKEEKGKWTKQIESHPIGQVCLDLTHEALFKAGWDVPVDQWFLLSDPASDVTNKVAKQSLKKRRTAGQTELYGAIHLRFAYESTSRRSPPSSRAQPNWYVGYPSAESIRKFPKHTFTMSDVKVSSEVSRVPEFTATQILDGNKGRTEWAAEVTANSRGELFMERGQWTGVSKGTFTAQQTQKL